MTIAEIIADIDLLKPNTYANEQKLKWINEVDSKIQIELMDTAINSVNKYEDISENALLDIPYSSIYNYYVFAQIDFNNNEIDSFNNNMVLFNNGYSEFAKNYGKQKATTNTNIKNIW